MLGFNGVDVLVYLDFLFGAVAIAHLGSDILVGSIGTAISMSFNSSKFNNSLQVAA